MRVNNNNITRISAMDFGIIQKLTNFIVRPPKSTYTPQDLGNPIVQYRNRTYQRDDFAVINNRGLELQCSFIRDKFAPIARETILFLHANSSSRLAIKNYKDIFLSYFDLLSFDFAGCGMSEGQYITLGYNQKEDVYSVISRVRQRYGVKDIILWGRSMGAATSIFYAAKYGGIKAVISDNSFSDLQNLVNELSDDYLPFVPNFLIETVLNSVQEHIEENVWKKEMTDFDIRKLKPISVISKVRCPIFFIGSMQDTFVNVQHTKQLYQKATTVKKLELVKGDHNDPRTTALKENVLKFLIGLNEPKRGSLKERVHIFSSTRGFSLKKEISEGCAEKIDKSPYYSFPTHFISDIEGDRTAENDQKYGEDVYYLSNESNNKDKQSRYFQQLAKKQEKNEQKRLSTPSTKRRRIFDGNDCIHRRLDDN